MRRGKIVNILTSATMGKPPSNMSDYLVGKYSLLGLSNALAVELAPFGINVNCISPSLIETNLTAKIPDKLNEILKINSPMNRLAVPADIASATLFLCSKYSDYISCENLLITGAETFH